MAPYNSNQRRLHEVHEAYQVFCENGTNRLAWRNLALLLTVYLSHFFNYNFGRLPIFPNASARARYLRRRSTSQIGQLTSNILCIIFERNKILSTAQDLVLAHRQTIILQRLSLLPELILHKVLVEVAIEFNQRSLEPSTGTGNRLESLDEKWRPFSDYGEGVDLLPIFPASYSGILGVVVEDAPKVDQGGGLRQKTFQRALSTRLSIKILESFRSPRIPNAEVRGMLDATGADSVTLKPYRNAMTIMKRPDSAVWEAATKTSANNPDHSLQEINAPFSISRHSISAQATFVAGRTFQTKLAKRPPNELHAIEEEKENISDVDAQRPISSTSTLLLNPPESSSFYSKSNISARSGISSYGSFVTAKSRPSFSDDARGSTSTRYSSGSFVSAELITSLELVPMICGSYYDLLRERDLIPDPMIEMDWSGRGQHAEYGIQELECIPLEVEKILGETRTAIVQSVRCKRVRLARKIMRCTKGTGLKREDAIREVEHLHRVQHSHVVRLVGTYVIGINLAILTYPCAEWNLEAFMRTSYTAEDHQIRSKSLRQFVTCLANVFDFMHSLPIKHMDIKPQNLLVRDIRNSQLNGSEPYKIYLTDFGISRAYASAEDCETETFTSFTRAYAAVEVVLQESRGLSADIFSLGCVYTEMLAVILDISNATKSESHSNWNSLLLARGRYGANFRPYHAAVEDTKTWLSNLPTEEPELCSVREWTTQMLDTNPNARPSARQIACDPRIPFPCLSCTLRSGPEDFEAAG